MEKLELHCQVGSKLYSQIFNELIFCPEDKSLMEYFTRRVGVIMNICIEGRADPVTAAELSSVEEYIFSELPKSILYTCSNLASYSECVDYYKKVGLLRYPSQKINVLTFHQVQQSLFSPQIISYDGY